MEEQLRFVDQIANAAFEMAIRFGPKLLVALLILAAGFFAGAGRAARSSAPSPSSTSSRRYSR
jgi:hypothetical protein